MKKLIFMLGALLFIFFACTKQARDDKGSTAYVQKVTNTSAQQGGKNLNGGLVSKEFEITGTPIGNGVYAFALNPAGTKVLHIHISTWNVCAGIQYAYGYITNFLGGTYTVLDDPEASNNFLSVQYTECIQGYNGTTCTSLCCQWQTSIFNGYLYKNGNNQDGSPKFVIKTSPVTVFGCPE